jgi:hypothetical protein
MSNYDWTIEITPTARAAISREIKAQWDGRELGGALVGHTDRDRIVVTNRERNRHRSGDSARRDLDAPGARTLVRVRASLRGRATGDWHCHPGGGSTAPSNADVRSWQATREALRSPVYLGLIFLPRRVVVQGINYSEAAWSFRHPETGEFIVTRAGYQRTRFVLSGEDRHELSFY